jgi:hypothetical protein
MIGGKLTEEKQNSRDSFHLMEGNDMGAWNKKLCRMVLKICNKLVLVHCYSEPLQQQEVTSQTSKTSSIEFPL